MTDTLERGPVEIEVDDLPDLPAVGSDTLDLDEGNGTRIVKIAARRTSPLIRWGVQLVLAVVVFALGIWAWDFVTGLLARNTVLGGIAVALVGLLVFVLLALTIREIAAIARLGRIESIRGQSEKARAEADLKSAQVVVNSLKTLHARRDDVAWGSARMAAQSGEIVDAGDLLDLTEREILAPLDARAVAEVEAAAARVATVTALVPIALADVATALYSNVAMIRRIAEIYGGRSGTLGAWRLTRAVIAHLAATGAVAIGDDLIGSALGGGVLSKLSHRFGEGLINGALTARVGITAIELCRPLPFTAEPKPKVTATVRRALTGLFSKE